jgi:hypothetical protein
MKLNQYILYMRIWVLNFQNVLFKGKKVSASFFETLTNSNLNIVPKAASEFTF